MFIEHLFLCVGVSPEILAVRVNGTFKIRCSVSQANGELNFYDGEELVSDPNVKV